MGCCQLKPNRIYNYSEKVGDTEQPILLLSKDKYHTNTSSSPKSRSTNSQRSLLGNSNEIFLDIDKEGSVEDKNIVDDNRFFFELFAC